VTSPKRAIQLCDLHPRANNHEHLIRTLYRNSPTPHERSGFSEPTHPKGFIGGHPQSPERCISCTLSFNRSSGDFHNPCPMGILMDKRDGFGFAGGATLPAHPLTAGNRFPILSPADSLPSVAPQVVLHRRSGIGIRSLTRSSITGITPGNIMGRSRGYSTGKRGFTKSKAGETRAK